MNPENQPTSPLDLAGVVMATPTAGLVIIKVTRVLRRRPRLSRVSGWAAAVGLGQGRGTCREAVWLIRGVRRTRTRTNTIPYDTKASAAG